MLFGKWSTSASCCSSQSQWRSVVFCSTRIIYIHTYNIERKKNKQREREREREREKEREGGAEKGEEKEEEEEEEKEEKLLAAGIVAIKYDRLLFQFQAVLCHG